MRISVETEGLYILTPSRLRSLGFTDPSKVRVYGYGSQRIPDALTAANYVDDLPEVYSEYVEGRGVVFYAVGSGTWSRKLHGRLYTLHNQPLFHTQPLLHSSS